MLYLSTQQVQDKWSKTKIRNWSEIYPQLCIFFEDLMIKYTSWEYEVRGGLHSLIYSPK